MRVVQNSIYPLPPGVRKAYAQAVVTDLDEVRRLGTAHARENLDFRRFLKAHQTPEGPFHILAAEVERQIDCRTCANCCRVVTVEVSDADVAALALHLRMPPGEVERLYTVVTAGERSLRQDVNGCVFLDGNVCMVYEARPRVCREFPYLTATKRSLGGRMSSICRNAWYCPIVYNTLELYKKMVGFRAAF